MFKQNKKVVGIFTSIYPIPGQVVTGFLRMIVYVPAPGSLVAGSLAAGTTCTGGWAGLLRYEILEFSVSWTKVGWRLF